MVINNEVIETSVTARDQIAARKTIRSHYGDSAHILTVREKRGGSTPKALAAYGVTEDQFNNEEEMFELVHEMRTRIIKSPAFDAEHIIGAILFEQTMDSKIDGKYTAEYLSDEKGIVPFLK